MKNQNSTQIPAKKIAQKDSEAIQKLNTLLESDNSCHKLVSKSGEEQVLPEPIYAALKKVIELMASGKNVTITAVGEQMTTQQAADFLNVSRPHLIKLLDQGKLPYHKTGSHRRIWLEDATRYKAQRKANQKNQLDRLTEFLQEEGFYS